MLELGELILQVLHDLPSDLVVVVARLRTLHAVYLALARHAVLHHVDMRHLLEYTAACARTADCNRSLATVYRQKPVALWWCLCRRHACIGGVDVRDRWRGWVVRGMPPVV